MEVTIAQRLTQNRVLVGTILLHPNCSTGKIVYVAHTCTFSVLIQYLFILK